MKVLHVITSLGSGGAEKLVVHICNELSKDHEVGLFVLENKNNFFADQVINNVDLYAANPSKYSLRTLLHLYKAIKKYDVIHVHLFPTLYFVSLFSIFFHSKKFIFTEHNTTNNRRKIRSFRIIEKLVYNRFSKITCISKAVKKHLVAWIGDNDKITLLYNFIDTTVINAVVPIDKKELGFSTNDILIVMVASFNNGQKRQQDVIEALAFLPEQYKAIFIGEGSRLNSYEELVNKSDLENRVSFLGKRKDVYSILKACDYGVLSSEWEGFGLVALEYMASGLPSFASNVEGLNEVVQDKNMLFEKNNPQELATKILAFKSDLNLLENILCDQQLHLQQFAKSNYFKNLQIIYNN